MTLQPQSRRIFLAGKPFKHRLDGTALGVQCRPLGIYLFQIRLKLPYAVPDGLDISCSQRGAQGFQRIARPADPLHLFHRASDGSCQARPFLENLVACPEIINILGATGLQQHRDLVGDLSLALLPVRQLLLSFLQFLLGIGTRSSRFRHVAMQVNDVVGYTGDLGVVAPLDLKAVGCRQRSSHSNEFIDVRLDGGNATLHLVHLAVVGPRQVHQGAQFVDTVGREGAQQTALLEPRFAMLAPQPLTLPEQTGRPAALHLAEGFGVRRVRPLGTVWLPVVAIPGASHPPYPAPPQLPPARQRREPPGPTRQLLPGVATGFPPIVHRPREFASRIRAATGDAVVPMGERPLMNRNAAAVNSTAPTTVRALPPPAEAVKASNIPATSRATPRTPNTPARSLFRPPFAAPSAGSGSSPTCSLRSLLRPFDPVQFSQSVSGLNVFAGDTRGYRSRPDRVRRRYPGRPVPVPHPPERPSTPSPLAPE